MLITVGGMLLAAMAAGSLMLVIWVVLLPTIAYATLRGVLAVGYGLVLGGIVQIVWSLASSRTFAFLLAASAVMAAVAAWRWCQTMNRAVDRMLNGADSLERDVVPDEAPVVLVAAAAPQGDRPIGRQRPAQLAKRLGRV